MATQASGYRRHTLSCPRARRFLPSHQASYAYRSQKQLIPLSKENILERFAVKLGPVWKTAYHRASVDEVKGVIWISPFVCDIVNLESAVGRYEVWLDGRKIDAENISRRMLISELAVFVSLGITDVICVYELTLPRYQFRILCQALSAFRLEDANVFLGIVYLRIVANGCLV